MNMGDPLIREPKNITDMNECAFKIGVEGNTEKSIQKILDSKPSGYRSKEETVGSIRLLFENMEALNALGKGYAISLIRSSNVIEGKTNFICSSRQDYCIGCGFNKPEYCDIPAQLYGMVSANGLFRRD